MKVSPLHAIIVAIISLVLPGCNTYKEEHHHEAHKVVATTPQVKSVTITEPYVCQIHSQRHIEVRALERGYLEKIPVREGQEVKAGDQMFTVIPAIYQAKFDAENADAKLAHLELTYTRKLFDDKVVSKNEVALLEAKLARANAQVK
jgi:membrane fusion protein (multidrug efflux system)